MGSRVSLKNTNSADFLTKFYVPWLLISPFQFGSFADVIIEIFLFYVNYFTFIRECQWGNFSLKLCVTWSIMENFSENLVKYVPTTHHHHRRTNVSKYSSRAVDRGDIKVLQGLRFISAIRNKRVRTGHL